MKSVKTISGDNKFFVDDKIKFNNESSRPDKIDDVIDELESFDESPYYQNNLDMLVEYVEGLENSLENYHSLDKETTINEFIDEFINVIKKEYSNAKELFPELYELTCSTLKRFAELAKNNLTNYINPTDKQKFTNLFNELNISFKENNTKDYGKETILNVLDNSLESSISNDRYSESVEVVFDENGKFKYFSGYGE